MIDEKKLIAEMREYIDEYKELDMQGIHNLKWCAMMDALELVESQPKVGKWIPCSERLPEKDGIYIVDDRASNSPWIHTAGFKASSKAWCENHGVYYDDKYGRYEDGRVTAWQPLPEPWKGENE